MNVRQQVVLKLENSGVVISGNELEGVLFEYKKKFGGKFRGIDLLFDVLDNENDFLDLLKFLKKEYEQNFD